MSRVGVVAALAIIAIATTAGGTVLAFGPTGQSATVSSPGYSNPGSTHIAAGDLANVTVVTLEGQTTQDYTVASLDIPTTLTLHHDTAAARLNEYARTEQLDQATDQQARVRLLFEATADLQARGSALRARDDALRAAYRNHTLTTAEYLNHLVVLHGQVNNLEHRLEHARGHAEVTPEAVTLIEQLATIRGRVSALTGPARATVTRSIMGQRSADRVFVATTPDGMIIALIREGRHIREVYRPDHQTGRTAADFGISDVSRRAQDLYPVAYASNTRFGVQTYAGVASGTFTISFQLQGGSITAFVDGRSANVYYEIQERELAQLPPGPPASVAANGTRLVVNRSFPGGPLRIATYDNATGDPLSIPVSVGPRPPVRTGDNGVHWTIAPRGRHTVTAIGSDGNATVRVWPTQPPTLR